MTRVVVQRGVGASSNPSQKRECTSSISSSASSLPHPTQPESSPPPGQVVLGSVSGEEEADQVLEHQTHRDFRNAAVFDEDSRCSGCSLDSKVHDRDEGAFKWSLDSAADSNSPAVTFGRWHELDLFSACRLSAEKKQVEVNPVGLCEEVGLEIPTYSDDDGACWASGSLLPHAQDVENARHDSNAGIDHLVDGLGASSVHALVHSQQTGALSTSAFCHQNAVLNSSVQQLPLEVVGPESMVHSPISAPQFTQCPSIEPSEGTSDPLDKEDIDAGRIDCSQNVTESVGCSYVSAPAPPIPCSLKSSGSSRRGGWVGLASSGIRSNGPPRRLPKAMKSARISPNNSHPSSPRSFGESDGYNSADEQSAWSSGPSAYEDDAEKERQFEVDLLRLKNLQVKRMAEDGNCLFRAVSDQVYGDTEMFDETRQMSIDYMEKERDHFSSFVTESFTAYCKRKRRDKVYGNNLEIQAMAEMYNRPIHIYSYSTEPINIFHGSYETDLPPMRLSYHRNNHYNSLVDPCKPAVGAGLGFGSLRGRNVDREQVKAAIKAQQEQQIDKALLAEGRYYSDLELTEQEIERMVMEASRAEYLAEESQRQQIPCNETSSSTSAMPSSSRTTGGLKGSTTFSNSFESSGMALRHTTRAVSPSTMTSTVLSSNVRMLLSMGFSYFRVMEAYSIFGDDVNNMLCYLLETDGCGTGDGEHVYRLKGKAAEG